MKPYYFVVIISALLSTTAYGFDDVGGPEDEENKIMLMREVTVQGEFDNPAFIIVPKAKIYKKELFKKSYYNDIVREIYFGTVSKGVDIPVPEENQKRR